MKGPMHSGPRHYQPAFHGRHQGWVCLGLEKVMSYIFCIDFVNSFQGAKHRVVNLNAH